jgi:hypothetical protein
LICLTTGSGRTAFAQSSPEVTFVSIHKWSASCMRFAFQIARLSVCNHQSSSSSSLPRPPSAPIIVSAITSTALHFVCSTSSLFPGLFRFRQSTNRQNQQKVNFWSLLLDRRLLRFLTSGESTSESRRLTSVTFLSQVSHPVHSTITTTSSNTPPSSFPHVSSPLPINDLRPRSSLNFNSTFT